MKDPLLIERGTSLARLKGFPEVLSPHEVRNDLYLTLSTGDFEKGKKNSPRNVEAYITVHHEDGPQFKDCIYSGIGPNELPVSEHVSMLFFHTNNPKWRETIKIVLPPEKFLRAHVRITFHHCSSVDNKDKGERKFCFAILPLARKSLVVQNGDHALPLYRYESTILENSTGRPVYLSESVAIPRFQKDVLVRTLLSSTSFTQNEHIHNILRAKNQQSEDEIKTALHLIQFSPPAAKDVLPFLGDFLDSLFFILERFVIISLMIKMLTVSSEIPRSTDS